MPPAPSGRYRDLARPGVLLVHRAGAMSLGTVDIFDTETEAAADSTAAALRVTCRVMITRARELVWSRAWRAAVAAPPGGLRGWAM
ncbi:AAA family ATPase, partial [Streptomyces populi]